MKRRILYVEDNPFNLLLIKRVLQAEGYEMIEALDGESGWHKAIHEQPDFIFMDLLMPGIDGFTLMRRIKMTPELNHIPIITLTAYGTPETKRKAEAAGCDGFLDKPADIVFCAVQLRRQISCSHPPVLLVPDAHTKRHDLYSYYWPEVLPHPGVQNLCYAYFVLPGQVNLEYS